MIRELRARHRRQLLFLAVALPVAVLVGLRARKGIPVMDPLPVEAPSAGVRP